MAVDDLAEHVGEMGVWIDAAELTILDQRGDDCPVLGSSAFLRLGAIGWIDLSTVLESISILPSSRKRVRPSQRDSA
jgi:hypothetical protein